MSQIPIGRVATGTHLDLLEGSLRRLQSELARREEEISTGLRVRRPSDDPLAAVRALTNRARLERASQYLENISFESGELSAADSALGELADIATRSREILQTQMNDTSSADTRKNAASEVAELLRDAVNIANRKFGARYLFGGTTALRPPVELVGSYAAFNTGALVSPEINIESGTAIPRSASGAEAFGALSAEIRGRADLDPRVTRDTKLADLNRGSGVRAGSVRVTDGLGRTAVVELSGADTVGDVLDRLNATGLVTAAINSAENGLELTAPGADLSVSEVAEGHAAFDLGILAAGAGPVLNGGDADPRMRLTTPLADLLAGQGLDLAGLTIRNGTIQAPVTLSGASTVGDLLNALNGSGAYVAAALGSDGTTIDLRSTLSGAQLSVVEGSGATAQKLGLIIDFSETNLDRLNGGLGVGEASGDDLRIVNHAGISFTVDISSATTVQDVIDLINNHPSNPGGLVASVEPGQNRLRLDDSSAGTEDLRVESLNGSFSAENLGLAARVPSPGSSLVGGDLNPSGVQVDSLFNALIGLRDGLAADDRSRMSLVGKKLDSAFNNLLDTRAGVGARVQRLERARDRLEGEKVDVQGLIDGDRGVDLAHSVAEFQREQTLLQAAYSVTGRILSLSILNFLR